MKKLLVAITIISIALTGWLHTTSQRQASAQDTNMTLSASDFSYLGTIPHEHAGGAAQQCPLGGNNTPLTLSWTNVPAGTKSLLLTMIDYTVPFPPGNFVHWIVYDIPPTWTGINPTSLANVPQGINGAGVAGYFGPCPPAGFFPENHVYTLTLYALDITLPRVRATLESLEGVMKKHTLAAAPYVGTVSSGQTGS